MDFNEKLIKISRKNQSLVCVGLDIDKDKIPKYLFQNSKTPFIDFNKEIIDNTKDFVCAYKLNLAFYEALGENGYNILSETIQFIPNDIIIISVEAVDEKFHSRYMVKSLTYQYRLWRKNAPTRPSTTISDLMRPSRFALLDMGAASSLLSQRLGTFDSVAWGSPSATSSLPF